MNDSPEMRPERSDAIRALLLDTIREQPARQARMRRRRWFTWGGVGILTLGIAATAGAIAVDSLKVSNETIVHCLRSDERAADGSYPSASASIADASGEGRVDDAIDLCTQMWAAGVFEPGYDPTSLDNPPAVVPDFQVCVMPDGSAAVVPSSNRTICQAIGLAPLTQ